jgi:hypothetical protein
MFKIANPSGWDDKWLERIFIQEDSVSTIFLMGDTGPELNGPKFRNLSPRFILLRGDDDPSSLCDPHEHHIPSDGARYRFDNSRTFCMCVGGAVPDDLEDRTDGYNRWCDNEAIKLEVMMSRWSFSAQVTPHVDVFLTHDAPFSVKRFMKNLAGEEAFEDPISRLLESLYRLHRPAFWFFSHLNTPMTLRTESTTFYSLGPREVISGSCLDDLDMDIDERLSIKRCEDCGPVVYVEDWL